MTKQEFLQGLRASLDGEVPAGTVQENLRYYDGYITSEVQKGRQEEEVTAELGDPRWIAKTIIEATPGDGDSRYETQGNTYREEPQRTPFSESGRNTIHYYDLNKWYVKLIAILVFMFIVWLLITIIGGVLSLVIPLLPVIGLVALVMWIVGGPRR